MGEQFSVTGGVEEELSTPDATGWFAILFNAI